MEKEEDKKSLFLNDSTAVFFKRKMKPIVSSLGHDIIIFLKSFK